MNWRDGIPDGVYRRFENEWIDLSVGMFRLGFQHGQAVVWQRSGERIAEDWVDGLRHGEWVVYDSQGTRLQECRIEHGLGVGRMRVLKPDGSLLHEGPNPYASLMVPELQQARRDAFRAGLAELHTRR